jgi:hypothetical protein
MLNNFFRINLPYGIAKNENGEWMAFNREYMPLGFNNINSKGLPGSSYQDLPVYTKYEKITEKFLLEIADSEYEIHHNEKGEIIKVFLYDDGTNPINQPKEKKHLWDSYFDKLKKLSRLKIG